MDDFFEPWLLHNPLHKSWLRHCYSAGGKIMASAISAACGTFQECVFPLNSHRGAVSSRITLCNCMVYFSTTVTDILGLVFLHSCGRMWAIDVSVSLKLWFLLCSWLPMAVLTGNKHQAFPGVLTSRGGAITRCPDDRRLVHDCKGIAILSAAVVIRPLFHHVIDWIIN